MGAFKKLILSSIALLFVVGGFLLYSGSDQDAPTVSFNSVEVEVEIAETSDQRAQGLSGRESLSSNEGMLFVFESADTHAFYMRDMNFSIDIIWMDDDFRVVDISANLAPESYPEIFRPEEPSRYVLEVVAGFADSHSVEVGDRAQVKGF